VTYVAASGPLTFARYAFPPNALGYCGPEDHDALLEYADAGVIDGGLRDLALGFSGAWPYLEIIAGVNGIDDPLDERVVDAYWIGNRLLDAVDRSTFGASLKTRFRDRSGEGWKHLAPAIPAGGMPHHSFHVFGVYPWVGLLRSGAVAEPLHIIDRCRIRWGTVLATSDDQAVVRYRPLEWDGAHIHLGATSVETVRTHADGKSLVPVLHAGDTVAMHWDWVCGRLSSSQETRLRRYSAAMLDLVNALPVPAPAAVLS